MDGGSKPAIGCLFSPPLTGIGSPRRRRYPARDLRPGASMSDLAMSVIRPAASSHDAPRAAMLRGKRVELRGDLRLKPENARPPALSGVSPGEIRATDAARAGNWHN